MKIQKHTYRKEKKNKFAHDQHNKANEITIITWLSVTNPNRKTKPNNDNDVMGRNSIKLNTDINIDINEIYYKKKINNLISS